MKPRVRCSFAALVIALASDPLAAQVAQRRGAIDGIVTDTSLAPLDGATAQILGSALVVRTGENGRFRMLGLLPGQYLVAVRRVGYAPISTFVTVAGDTVPASFLLRPLVTELDAMKVRATSVASALTEFEARRASGVGQFMTEADIHRLNFVETTGLLKTFLSTSVRTAGVMNIRGFGLRECPMQIFVDGVAIGVVNLEADLPRPSEIAGIEVHASSPTVPLQYATTAGGASCGVILLWTKH